MSESVNVHDAEAVMQRLRRQAAAGDYRLAPHAEEEMAQEETGRIRLFELLEAFESGRVLENYPDANRGSCCLVYGNTETGRPLHIVCTTSLLVLVVITVYQPVSPYWTTPTERGDFS